MKTQIDSIWTVLNYKVPFCMKMHVLKWCFDHWLFSWRVDREGDIALVVCNRLAFIKYKQSTIIKLGSFGGWEEAKKYVEAKREEGNWQ